MEAVERPFAPGELEAYRLSAGAFLSRLARVALAKLGFGLVLFLAGSVTLGSAQGSADALAANGVHVTAIVTDYRPSNRAGGGDHITVSYPTPNGVETNVTVWTNQLSWYRISQRVQISYDSSNPRRAVLAKGDSASPIAGLYLFILFCGLLFVLVAVRSFFLRKRCRRALAGEATSALVDTAKLGRSTLARLDDGSGQPAALTVLAGRDWPGCSTSEAMRSAVFRDSEARRPTTIIVDRATGAVLVGRTTRQAARWLASNSMASSP